MQIIVLQILMASINNVWVHWMSNILPKSNSLSHKITFGGCSKFLRISFSSIYSILTIEEHPLALKIKLSKIWVTKSLRGQKFYPIATKFGIQIGLVNSKFKDGLCGSHRGG